MRGSKIINRQPWSDKRFVNASAHRRGGGASSLCIADEALDRRVDVINLSGGRLPGLDTEKEREVFCYKDRRMSIVAMEPILTHAPCTTGLGCGRCSLPSLLMLDELDDGHVVADLVDRTVRQRVEVQPDVLVEGSLKQEPVQGRTLHLSPLKCPPHFHRERTLPRVTTVALSLR